MGTISDPTIRDVATTLGYEFVKSFETPSGEAELCICRKDGKDYVLKRYYEGRRPKIDVIDTVNKLTKVAKIIDYGEYCNRFFEIIEFISGGDLSPWAKSSVSEQDCREILEQLADCLEEVHNKKIIHRDIKPSNILVKQEHPLELVLTDFGISSITNATVHVTNTNRTPRYAAPEASMEWCTGVGCVSYKSDWHSVGIVLLEILCGTDSIDKWHANISENGSCPIPIPSEFSLPWRPLLDGLRAFDPNKRWGLKEVREWLKDPDRFTGKDCLVVDLVSGEVMKLSSWPSDLLTNDDYKTTKMVLNRIPAGTFMMGSPETEMGRNPDEDLHQVTLTKDFYMAVFECTQAQYAAIMDGADPSYYKGAKRPVEKISWDTVRGGTWPSGDPGGTSFMARLKTRTGRLFDLPTEAQWEYACRAGTTKAYNNDTDCLCGDGRDQDTNLDPLAWYACNSGESHNEVGTKQANAWGLYDMHGNVWEWCLDWYKQSFGTNPVNDPEGSPSGYFRVIRGGGWGNDAGYCRSANRDDHAPNNTHITLGFRACILADDLVRVAEIGPRETPKPPPVKQTRRKTIVSFLIVDLLSGSVKELSSSPADLLTNDDYKTAKMVLNRIPAGTFMMGAPTSENGRDYYEDLHQVTLTKDFYMAVFECTQAQYAAIMGGSDPSYFKGSMRPVEQVSWNTVRGGTWPSGEPDGTSFMGCLRTKTGLLFDLPTEAQWEYACRAGTTNAYNNDTDCLVGSQGGQDTNLDPLAWYNFNSSKSHREVGTKQANYWGLYDMHGNVWEWCLDYNEAGLGTNPVVNPVGALFEGSFRVIRGGSWDYFAKFCRSACRSDYTPGNTSNNLGFRVCLADF